MYNLLNNERISEAPKANAPYSERTASKQDCSRFIQRIMYLFMHVFYFTILTVNVSICRFNKIKQNRKNWALQYC